MAKGTVKALVSDISYEVKTYQHLQTLQGTAIPICFAYVILRHGYHLDLGVKISHMLLLSWGGETISKDSAGGLKRRSQSGRRQDCKSALERREAAGYVD